MNRIDGVGQGLLWYREELKLEYLTILRLSSVSVLY